MILSLGKERNCKKIIGCPKIEGSTQCHELFTLIMGAMCGAFDHGKHVAEQRKNQRRDQK